ncbi:hypothetical protein HYH03_010983 [Edaphochlamys debaryana]|uniref:Uncharacterized protein n=1 Tax=Edaphochlamys debaryana TaxID=47281 RepID=A0A835XVI8_9CHLO|nr:hypothetical protein HYH03_010983 [Edaphochlamys debaryana]|eukprot:KAG2490590.1 hypothetical protein HYH03_010983 [Edaphochlamys debaryana]
MKCKRSTGSGARQDRSGYGSDTDYDDEDYQQDVGAEEPAGEEDGGGERSSGSGLAAGPHTGPRLPTGSADPACLGSLRGNPSLGLGRPDGSERALPASGLDLNAASDPPGALGGYLGSESDLPAPAAPSEELLQRLAKPAPAGMRWVMQPDPVAPSASCGFEPCEPAGVASLRGDSAYSLMSGAEAQHAGSKRLREEPQMQQLSNTRPRPAALVNPFADIALQMAQLNGLPPAPAMPAARDAAALLNSASWAKPITHASAAPAWMRASEVDALLGEMGIWCPPGMSLPGQLQQQRPSRALTATARLALPAARPGRDLNSLLRRGLPPPELSAPPPAAPPPPPPGVACTLSSCAETRLSGCGANAAAGEQGYLMGGSRLPRPSDGSTSRGVYALHAIDCLPLEALL